MIYSTAGVGQCSILPHRTCQTSLLTYFSLDVWVTSSGLLGPPSITNTGPADLQRCFETNSVAPFLALKYAPAAMAKTTPKGKYPNAAPKDQKYGSIIVVSSVASSNGGEQCHSHRKTCGKLRRTGCWGPAYTMSSHAALGLVRAGVATLKGSGVRINCISPGQIDAGVSLMDVRSLLISESGLNADND